MIMKSAVIFGVCVLFGTLIFTATYTIAVSEEYTHRNQQLMGHLANLKAHAQSPLVRNLLETMEENTEDVNVAMFVQDLLDLSQAQDMTDQSAFGRKEAEAAFATFQSLPEKAQAQLIFTTLAALAVPIAVALFLGLLVCLACTCLCGYCF